MSPLLKSFSDNPRIRELRGPEDLDRPGDDVDILAVPDQPEGELLVGFAASDRCVEAALRLRYEVFNLELGEGLAESHLSGLDRDEFDAQMTHIVLLHRETERIVGTFRVQTLTRARARRGVYSELEFDLSPLAALFDDAVELGRVCIAPEHRSLQNLFLLFAGVKAFMRAHRLKWMFGCCSVTTTDPDDGWRALRQLRKRRYVHETLVVPARASHSCGDPSRESDPALEGKVALPPLFTIYARLGAKVVSLPGIDREFGTVDFIVLLDGTTVEMPSLTLRE